MDPRYNCDSPPAAEIVMRGDQARWVRTRHRGVRRHGAVALSMVVAQALLGGRTPAAVAASIDSQDVGPLRVTSVVTRSPDDIDAKVRASIRAALTDRTTVYWIGGAADKRPFFGFPPHHHFESVMMYWQARLPGRDEYRGYDEWRQVVDEVRRLRAADADCPIVVIGHSFGAASAMRVAERLEHEGQRIDLLVTLDGVWPFALSPPARPHCWINVHQRLTVLDYVARVPLIGPGAAGVVSLLTWGAWGHFSDTVATVGRQLGPQPAATWNIETDLAHGAGNAMLRLALPLPGTD